MAEVRVTAESVINAPAERVYGCLADFNGCHQRILPPAFSNFRVEEGGVGAGTVIAYTLSAGGRKRAARARVDEPQPGRVLTETDLSTSLVTTFTVTPGGESSHVRIESRWQGASGFGGLMERLFAPRVLSRLYADELRRLAAQTKPAA
jgi:hypothetical protein